LRLRGDALLPVLDFLSGTPSRSILSNSSVSCFVLRICRSHDPEYPTLDRSDFLLFRRQRRFKKAFQRTALVCPLQPCCYRVGGLLVAVSAIPRKEYSLMTLPELCGLVTPGVADFSTGAMGILHRPDR
jgi:hypothetical protein